MYTSSLLTTFLLTTLSLAAPTPTTPKRQDLGELEGILETALPVIVADLPNALDSIINGVDTPPPTGTEEQKRQADNELEDALETALPVIVANLPNAVDSIINGVDTPADKRQDPGELEGVLETALPVIVANLPSDADGIVNGD
ncbi:hypothetical protein LTR17_017370 [Elasticomyces elasticus]|nr:hypothetical protein LTR17_017370 [Elasticomyces elasticus]